MNRRIVTTLTLLFAAASWNLQADSPIDEHLQWDRTYSLPKGYESSTLQAVIQTQDGGFVTVGNLSDSDTQRAFVMKIDAQGKKKWTKLLGRGATAYGIAQGPDRTLYVVETRYKNHYTKKRGNAYLVALNPQGKRLWSREYPLHTARGIVPASDSDGYLVVGSETPKKSDSDLWIAKIDPRGKILWQKRYGGPGSDYGVAITPLSGGGYLVGGTRDNGGSNGADFWMLHLDESGRKVWDFSVKFKNRQRATSVCEFTPGRYAIAGINDIASLGLGIFFFAGIDESEAGYTKGWGKLIDRGNASMADTLLPDGAGGLLVGGALGFAGNLIDRKPVLYDYDGTGKERWHTELSGKGEVKAMIRTRDGGLLLVLDYNSFMAMHMRPRILKIAPSTTTNK